MNTFAIALLSIILSVVAQFSFKTGMSGLRAGEVLSQPLSLDTALTVLTNKFVVGGFVLYGLGAVFWLAVLSRWDVSKAYPLVGVGFAITVAIGFALGEHVTLPRVIGVALISAGVFLVGQS